MEVPTINMKLQSDSFRDTVKYVVRKVLEDPTYSSLTLEPPLD